MIWLLETPSQALSYSIMIIFFCMKLVFPTLLLSLLIIQGYSQSFDLKSGDLLFVGSSASGLSEAIDQVTQTSSNQHYVHVALVESKNDTTWVIHADSEDGVIREPLNAFISDRPVVDAFRIQTVTEKHIQSALSLAHKQIGQPYNFSYVMSDSGYYCSELIYEVYNTAQIFELNPMTFKDPETKAFYQAWVEHYEKLGIPIPEDKPGCNPNGMAADSDLVLLGTLK